MIRGSAASRGKRTVTAQGVAGARLDRQRAANAARARSCARSGRRPTASTPGIARAARKREHRLPVVGRPVGQPDRHRRRVGRLGAPSRDAAPPAAAGRGCWKVSLKRRTLPKPDASATSVIGRFVSWISCLASSTRRVCATATGEAPRCWLKQAAQLPAADAEAAGQGFDAAVVRAPRPRSAPARGRRCSTRRARRRCRARARAGSAGRAGSPPPAPPRRRSRS